MIKTRSRIEVEKFALSTFVIIVIDKKKKKIIKRKSAVMRLSILRLRKLSNEFVSRNSLKNRASLESFSFFLSRKRMRIGRKTKEKESRKLRGRK